MVLAVEVDALAGVEVGPDRDGGVAIVGVDEEVGVTDVVVDLLGFGGDLSDLGAGGPCLFLVDGFPELGHDLDGDPRGDQFSGGVLGPVGLLVVDAGQDQGVVGDDVPASRLTWGM
ncbi:hypothetical protein ACH4CC_16845 [Streptomyces lydicus]|uniref:hypothetical protein n=1 Tax=Streptomyces lydicus TaxID=47763 RepID=UPI003794E010